MAVSNGGSGVGGGGQFTQSVITAAPGTAQFDGVWLIGEAWGKQAASPNVGLALDTRGLTVTGPGPGQSNTIPWTWVQHFGAGSPMTFPDGRTATVVEVALIGRSITLLVPTDQLRNDEIEELNRYVPTPTSVPEPPPPFEALGAEETIHFTDVPEHKEIPEHADSDQKKDPPKKPAKERGRRIETRSTRLAILLACLVAVAIAGTALVALRIKDDNTAVRGVVIPQAPPTTAPPAPSTLNGPGKSVTALTAAEEVSLSLTDLPAGWSRVVLVPKSSVPSAFGDVKPTLDRNLASCLGLPLSHVGIITGNAEPGGPKVLPSGIYVMNSGLHPSAISLTSLVSSASVERSDLSKLLEPGTSPCLDKYYASSYASEHITTPPLVNRFNVPQHAGEQVIGLDVHIGITQNGRASVYDYDVVVIGAGRLEIALGAQQNNEPFPNVALDRAVSAMEARAAVAAGGH